MTMLIKNGQRYSLRQLRADNPGVSFPREPSAELLAQYGVYEVARVDPPAYDPMTQRVVESFPSNVHTWTVEALPAEEVTKLDNGRELTFLQFRHMLAKSGLEDTVDTYLSGLKASNLAKYAHIKARMDGGNFTLGDFLSLAPDLGVNEATMRSHWNSSESEEMTTPFWRAGMVVAVGDKVLYEGITYETIQAHTTQAGWMPPIVPALFAVV